jgi:iron(III) transport system substrate-binding protein
MFPVKKVAVPALALSSVIALMGMAGFGGQTFAAAHKVSHAQGKKHGQTKSKVRKSQGQLVLYSAQGYDKAMAVAFEKATGIRVTLVDDSTGTIIAKMEAERSNPHWDVAWFDGASSMQALDDQGMLLRGWTPDDIGNYTALGLSMIPRDKSYYPGGLTAAAALGYNPHVLSAAQLPHTLLQLENAKYRGMLAMNDPSISGPTYPFVAGVIQQLGLKQGEQFFLKLKQNGLRVYRTNKVTIRALLAGRAKMILVQDSALIASKVKGDPIAIDYLRSGVYTLPDVLSIDAHAPDMANAKRFIEWVLTQQGQHVMINPKNGGGDSYYNPVIKGIHPNPERQQAGINWVRVNPIKAALVENQLKTWFHDNITE